MRITEIVLAALILLGLIFKFTLIPGGGLLLTAGFTFLSMLYFFFGFALLSGMGFRGMLKSSSFSELSTLKVMGFVGAGWSLSTLCLGILFKVQYWPGSEIQLTVGLVTAMIVVGIALFKYLNGKRRYYRSVLLRFFILGSFSLIMISVSTSEIERLIYRNHPEYLNAYENYLQNPDDPKLKEKMEIEQLRTTMSDEDVEIYLEYQRSQSGN